MGVRRPWIVVAMLLVPAGARASDHNWDMFFAPPLASKLDAKGSAIDLWGGHISVALSLVDHDKKDSTLLDELLKDVTYTADLSAHYLGGDETDLKKVEVPCTTEPATKEPDCSAQPDRMQITFMGGPRWTPLGGLGAKHRYRPFVHALFFGLVHRAGGRTIGGTTSGAMVLGGGFEWVPGEGKTWGWRFQADYVWPVSSDLPHGFRYSVGVVYRSHHSPLKSPKP